MYGSIRDPCGMGLHGILQTLKTLGNELVVNIGTNGGGGYGPHHTKNVYGPI